MIGAGTTAKSAAMLTHHQETPNRETYEFREHAWKWYDEKWAPEVNELLGINVPIRHTQGPILVLQADKPVSLPFTFFEEGVYIREESTSQSFAGKLATEYEKSQTVDPDHKHSIDESMYLQVAEVAETYLSEHPEFDIVNE